MKGIIAVLCAVLTVTVIIPLAVACAYYGEKPEEVQIADGADKSTQVLRADSVTQPTAQDSESEEYEFYSSSYYEDVEFALSPRFSLQFSEENASPSVTEEETKDTVEEDAEQTEQAPPEEEKEPAEKEPATYNGEKMPTTPEEEAEFEDSYKFRIYNHRDKTYESITLTEYLYGVVAAEMPAYFELEALKAQAIACRSFTLYKMSADGDIYHSSFHGTGADLCTFSGHCQGYCSYDDAVEKWGKSYTDGIFEKVREAVDSTKGIFVLYDGKPINAAYHSSSYKSTDSQLNVWGTDIPYLQAVSSPEDDDFDTAISSATFTSAKFMKYVKSLSSKVSFDDDPSKWAGKITRNESGRVETFVIAGVEFTGREIQSVFGLRSANYKLRYDEETDKFIFTVRGFGHGVGMSQYGANLMAIDGATCTDILKHYYSETTVGGYRISLHS